MRKRESTARSQPYWPTGLLSRHARPVPSGETATDSCGLAQWGAHALALHSLRDPVVQGTVQRSLGAGLGTARAASPSGTKSTSRHEASTSPAVRSSSLPLIVPRVGAAAPALFALPSCRRGPAHPLRTRTSAHTNAQSRPSFGMPRWSVVNSFTPHGTLPCWRAAAHRDRTAQQRHIRPVWCRRASPRCGRSRSRRCRLSPRPRRNPVRCRRFLASSPGLARVLKPLHCCCRGDSAPRGSAMGKLPSSDFG